MELKQLLDTVFWHHSQIEAKMLQIDRLQELQRFMYRFSNVQAESEKQNVLGFSGATDMIVESMEMISDEIKELLYQRWDVIDLINHLKNARQRLVMTMRYLDSSEWEDIEDELKCSLDEVKDLHDKALRHMEKTSKKLKKNKKTDGVAD